VPTKFWLVNRPEGMSLISLVRLAKIRWWIEQGYQQLKDELGLDHYEGRTWQGWHHHVTLTMLAFGFLTLAGC
jgi:SRSO17 transposase